MPEYLSPGVYVEEFAIGATPIEGVSTSTVGFVGIAEKGPLNIPTLVTSIGQFADTFGDFIPESYLAYSVAGFFQNGGKRCFVVRVAGGSAEKAFVELPDRDKPAPGTALQICAANEGAWGKAIKVKIDESSSGATFLYAASLKEATVPGSHSFSPSSTSGLAKGDVVKISDGFYPNDSSTLRVTDVKNGEVQVDAPIGSAFPVETSRVFAVVSSQAGALSSASVISARGFEKGELVSFIEAEMDPAYVNATAVSLSDNKIFWQGQPSRNNTTLSAALSGARLVDSRRVDLDLNIKTALPTPTPTAPVTTIDVGNIGGLPANTVIRNGDSITFGGGATKETVVVTSVSGSDIVFTPELKNTHVSGEQFTVKTAPQSKLYWKQSPAVTGDLFDTGVQGFEMGDVLTFTKATGGTEERNIASVTGTQVKLNSPPSANPTKVEAKMSDTATAVVIDPPTGFQSGDLVEVTSGSTTKVLAVDKIEGNRLFLKSSFGQNTTSASFVVKEWKTTEVKTVDFGIKVRYEKGKNVLEESFEKLSLNLNSGRYVENDGVVNKVSRLIEVKDPNKSSNRTIGIQNLPALTPAYVPLDQGGTSGITDIKPTDFVGADKGKGERTGLVAFEAVDDINILCVPDIMAPNQDNMALDRFSSDNMKILQSAMISHCENMGDRFAVIDSPKKQSKTDIQAWKKDNFDSEYAALYYPWIEVMDPISAENSNIRLIPPSGYIAGIYARSDTERGVHKAPANEVVRGVIKLEFPITSGEQDILNPDGVNCIRALPGRGIRVWGARTMSSDGLWKYVNVRRLFLFLEESIDQGTQWVVFEPNDGPLWARVKQTINQFLTGVWRTGALAGGTPEEAFFVKCDRTTMTQDDIDNGRLICVIGVAPVKPAEFVIFRIAQWTAGAK